MAVEHRTRHPLLPLRIVTDRSRGGAYASMAIVGAALFSVFLFMTFYMQQILRFSPGENRPGVPAAHRCRHHRRAPGPDQDPAPPRSPGGDHVTGMTLGIIAMIIFTRLTPGGSYASHVLPGLIPAGAGAACVFSASFATGTLGVRHTDAGVAVGRGQHRPADRRLDRHRPAEHHLRRRPGRLPGQPPRRSPPAAVATVHAYTAGFTAGAVIFAIGLLLALVLLPSQRAIRARMAAAGASSESNESRESPGAGPAQESLQPTGRGSSCS